MPFYGDLSTIYENVICYKSEENAEINKYCSIDYIEKFIKQYGAQWKEMIG